MQVENATRRAIATMDRELKEREAVAVQRNENLELLSQVENLGSERSGLRAQVGSSVTRQ